MNNVLGTIQAAETEAANIVAKAKEDALQIIEDAKAKCGEVSKAKIAAAHQSAEKTVADAKAEGDLLYEKIISEYNLKCTETEKSAQAKISAAAKSIIENLV